MQPQKFFHKYSLGDPNYKSFGSHYMVMVNRVIMTMAFKHNLVTLVVAT